jgi:hypothetical protein
MPTLPFGEYRPDNNDLDAAITRAVNNVIPRADGYGPFQGHEAFTDTLPAACRGYFYARNSDNTITIFAGTSTELYKMSNTDFTWTNVSVGGGPYAALAADANWQFAQFNEFVFAVHAAVDPQVWNLTSSTDFAALGGTPPKAAYVSIVNRFVVLTGLAANAYRVQWSGLNETDNWTSGTNSSDYQDLPDGGIVRPVLGGEFGIILQDQSIRRMTFSPGSETIFDIQRLAKDIGVLAPYSACSAGDRAFFISPKGPIQITGAGELLPIGEEKVTRTFLADYDASNMQLVIGAADPERHVVLFVYKTGNNANATFNKGLLYNFLLQRWAPIEIEGEYLAPFASPGLTMEGLDAIAPGALTITGAGDNGSGKIRITVASTATLSTDDYKTISGAAVSTVDFLGTWKITVVNGTTFDLEESDLGVASVYDSVNVTGTANGTGNVVRLTVTSTANMTTGERRLVAGVGGTTEANGNWLITVVDGTHVELTGTTYANAWTSGGTIGDYWTSGGIVAGSLDELPFSLDAVSTSSLPALSMADDTHAIGFFSGDNLEATLETPEQSADGRRIKVKGFYPVTDAGTVYGRLSKRENLTDAITYTAETAMNARGFVPQLRDTRYTRAKIRIPAGTAWSYASGIVPDSLIKGRQ